MSGDCDEFWMRDQNKKNDVTFKVTKDYCCVLQTGTSCSQRKAHTGQCHSGGLWQWVNLCGWEEAEGTVEFRFTLKRALTTQYQVT